MKNLFKNLMLVAVAAMAFTACEKGNDETNKTEQKTVITGVATIANDDTRSGFLPKEDGETAYQSAWDGGEKVAVHYDGSGDVWTNMNADGTFEVTLDGAVSAITLCSPYEAWWGTVQVNPSIFATQTPFADSVDPKVHVLKSEETSVVNGTASVTMKHEVAYGKMTVNTPADFKIARVELTINGYTTYTIKADNVVNNVFWFAVPEYTVNKFALSAYNSDGEVYTKTVDNIANGDLMFTKGRVSNFSISNLEKQEEKGTVLTKATASIAEGITSYGKQCYNIYFKTEDETVTVWVQVGIDGTSLETEQYTNVYGATYSINNCTWTGVDTLWPLNMNVEVINGQYSITFYGVDYTNSSQHNATFVGAIEGLTLPSTEPVMSITPNELVFSAEAGSKDISVTTKNTTESINATSDNAQFTVTVNGNTVTVTAAENTTSDEIIGTITIACGSLSDTVTVTQKGAGSAAADGKTVATAYTFTNCSVELDMGSYPYMKFSGAENGYSFDVESNIDMYIPVGELSLDKSNYSYFYASLTAYRDAEGNSVSIDDKNSLIKFTEVDGGFKLEYVKIVTSTSEVCYYKYDGLISF